MRGTVDSGAPRLAGEWWAEKASTLVPGRKRHAMVDRADQREEKCRCMLLATDRLRSGLGLDDVFQRDHDVIENDIVAGRRVHAGGVPCLLNPSSQSCRWERGRRQAGAQLRRSAPASDTHLRIGYAGHVGLVAGDTPTVARRGAQSSRVGRRAAGEPIRGSA